MSVTAGAGDGFLPDLPLAFAGEPLPVLLDLPLGGGLLAFAEPPGRTWG